MTASHRRFIRLREVRERTGLSTSTIYELIARNKFPAQIKLTGHASAWDSGAIDSWMDQRIAASAKAVA